MELVMKYAVTVFVCLALFAATGCEPAPVSIPAADALPLQNYGETHRLSADVPGVGNVRYSIHISGNYRKSTPAPLVLLLHYGYEGSKPEPHTGADMIDTFRQPLHQFGAVAIAPDVTGGDWTRGSNEIAAVWLVKSAMKTYNIDPSKVIIAGYSMGGAGTWFIGSRHQDLFTAAVPVAAPVAGKKEWKIPVHVIHSDKDQVAPYSRAKSHAAAVRAAGGTVHFTTAEGLDHYDANRYRMYFHSALQSIE